ncbi:MAG TPA: hypothetical protein VI585_05205, partial [Candidatus Binatia bacterium]
LNERRLKLESAIRAADAASKLHLEKAALRDIEAYRHLQRLHLSHAHERRLNAVSRLTEELENPILLHD